MRAVLLSLLIGVIIGAVAWFAVSLLLGPLLHRLFSAG